jgi:hypothetical protein
VSDLPFLSLGNIDRLPTAACHPTFFDINDLEKLSAPVVLRCRNELCRSRLIAKGNTWQLEWQRLGMANASPVGFTSSLSSPNVF